MGDGGVISIGEALDRGGRNNFDLIRLIAALAVVWSHDYMILGAGDRLAGLLLGYDTGGGFGVTLFFVISGFLVTRSAARRPPWAYLRARALRLLPALAVVVLASVLLLGPLATALPLEDYFTAPATWDYLRTILLLSGPVFVLPGVFGGAAVNGSLWTLPLEAGFYLLLVPLKVLGGLARGVILAVLAAFAVSYAVATGWGGYGWGAPGPVVWSGICAYPALRYGLAFFTGAALWAWRDRVPLSGPLALAGLLGLWGAAGSAAAPVAYALCLPYLVIYAALAHPLRFDLTGRIGDLSYGTYLLAFPIQQSLIHALGPGVVGPMILHLTATPLALAGAALLWRRVERPCLARKGGGAGAG
ncbi:MAG: hypothetical protein RLZZ501_1198 [Pseudomonadota bacterium]|jgi:peptidoglycan/LPS O-acetylase OafA/YrhL